MQKIAAIVKESGWTQTEAASQHFFQLFWIDRLLLLRFKDLDAVVRPELALTQPHFSTVHRPRSDP